MTCQATEVKKWNKFDCIAFLLAGLPKEMNTSLKNIHFLATSNRVSVLELLRPIVDELKTLEMESFCMTAIGSKMYL